MMEHRLAVLSLLLVVVQLISVRVESVPVRPCIHIRCDLQCPYGRVVNTSDCTKCACRSKPRLTPGNCRVICRNYCPNGRILDFRGCPTCKCKSNAVRV